MALPHDLDIQTELLRLLAAAPNGRLHCRQVYSELAERFPRLTHSEVTDPYRASLSHWANRVQFARLHLVIEGRLLHSSMSGGRGYWAISDKGRASLDALARLTNKLFSEVDALPA